MADLLALSTAILDEGKGVDDVGPINRINQQLSVIGDGIAMVEAFSHCVLFETDDGLVAFDTSNPQGGPRVVEQVRHWRGARDSESCPRTCEAGCSRDSCATAPTGFCYWPCSTRRSAGQPAWRTGLRSAHTTPCIWPRPWTWRTWEWA